MSDRYSQLVRLPVAGTVAQADRAAAAGRARARLVRRRAAACCSAAPGGVGRGRGAGAGRRWAPTRRPRWTTRCATLPRAAGLDAAVFNPAAPADQTFKALVFDATGIVDVGGARRAAAVLLSDDPARAAVRPRDRARRRAARALEGFTRSLGQGGRRAGRRSTSCTSTRAPRTGSARRCGSCSRRARRTSPGRSIRVGCGTRAARSPAGPRSSPAPRAGSAPRSPTVLEREGATVVRLDLQGRGPRARHHRDPTRPRVLAERFADGLDIARPQRGRDQGPHAGEDARGPLAVADGGQPARARADHRGAAAGARATTAGSSACRR